MMPITSRSLLPINCPAASPQPTITLGLNAHQPHNDYSFVRNSQPISLITAIIRPFGPRRHRACGSRGRTPLRRLQPNPHSAR